MIYAYIIFTVWENVAPPNFICLSVCLSLFFSLSSDHKKCNTVNVPLRSILKKKTPPPKLARSASTGDLKGNFFVCQYVSSGGPVSVHTLHCTHIKPHLTLHKRVDPCDCDGGWQCTRISREGNSLKPTKICFLEKLDCGCWNMQGDLFQKDVKMIE